MTKKPASVDGSRWAFMKRTDIPDVSEPGVIYLTRWRLVQTPWFAVYLHKIMRPDGDRALHNHPYGFAALILRGGYREEVFDRSWYALHEREHGPLDWNVIPHGRYHNIRTLLRVPTWTLLFAGPRQSSWGFLTADGEHVDWQTYIAENYSTNPHPTNKDLWATIDARGRERTHAEAGGLRALIDSAPQEEDGLRSIHYLVAEDDPFAFSEQYLLRCACRSTETWIWCPGDPEPEWKCPTLKFMETKETPA